jgi:hypothetical protein
MLSKSSLEWPAQATNHPRSSDEKLASAFTKRSDPLDVQAEATDADTFEALWRTRGRSQLVDGAQVEQLERYHRSCGAVVIGLGRSSTRGILSGLLPRQANQTKPGGRRKFLKADQALPYKSPIQNQENYKSQKKRNADQNFSILLIPSHGKSSDRWPRIPHLSPRLSQYRLGRYWANCSSKFGLAERLSPRAIVLVKRR